MKEAQQTLAEALKAAGSALDTQALPPALRSRVLAAVQRAPCSAPPPQATARAPRWLRWTAWSGGGAALAMLLLGSVLLVRLPPPAAPAVADLGEFMPLVPQEDWPRDTTPAWLVASEVSQERLAALGLPYDPGRAGERVRAELLVAPSGRLLALRLID
jgi:hypothetical protein